MKTKLLAKFNMFLSLKNHLGKNQKRLESIKEIEKAFKKFNSNLADMQGLKGDLETDLKGLVDKKEKGKKTLINEATPIINILRAFANDKKSKDLKKKVNFSKKKLEKIKDLKLSASCKTIWKESRKLLNKSLPADGLEDKAPNILHYGLSRNMIDTLDEVNQNFNNACAIYMTAKSEKQRYEKEFESLVKKNESILKNKLDLLLSVFEQTDPEFYKQYKQIREIEKKPKDKTPVKKEVAAKSIITTVKPPVAKPVSPAKTSPARTTAKPVQKAKTPVAKKKPPVPTNPNKIGGQNPVK
jgi:hypothetical protein